MPLRLYIAEKPSVAVELAKNLSGPIARKDGYYETGGGLATWLVGHVLRQAMPEEYNEGYKSWRIDHLPIIPSSWKLLVSSHTKDHFKKVKELIGKADEIVHVGDPDREGQLLVDEVLDYVVGGREKAPKMGAPNWGRAVSLEIIS